MATSGSYDFTINRNQLIKEALEKIGVVDPTATPSDALIESTALKLNIMTKAWMARGLHLWRRIEATLFLEASKQVYLLGPAGDHCTAEINAVQASTTGITAMRVAGVSTDTTLEVDSTTGMTAGDYIGVVCDDNTIHWTTIVTVTDSDTVTITTGLDAAAAVDNAVYHYTSKIQRPLRIETVALRRNGIDSELFPIADRDYQRLSTKGTTGSPSQFYYDAQRDTAGRLHVWLPTSTVNDTLYLIGHRPVQDFDAAEDNLDFPIEWARPLVYGLAYDIAPGHGIPLEERALLKIDRDEALADVDGWDIEDTSIYFGVDRQ